MAPVVGLFGAVMGSIYLNIASPTEAAAVGAFGAMLLAALRGRLTWEVIRESLVETAQTTAVIFLILIGTSVLQFFIETSTLPAMLLQLINDLKLPPIGVIIIIMSSTSSSAASSTACR